MAAHQNHRCGGKTMVRYRPEIDGLRALAVAAVIANHFDTRIVPSGYLGVDLFFVLSGYVITLSLFEDRSKKFVAFISGFYARRIKRLVPGLVIMTLLSALLICIFSPQPRTSLNTAITAIFGLSNVYLAWSGSNYFTESANLNPFTHTWSLGVEEQFYFIFPLLVFLSGLTLRTILKNFLYLVLFFVSALSLALFVWTFASHPILNFYLMPIRFWELAGGCFIAVLVGDRSLRPGPAADLMAGAAVLGIASLFFVPQGHALAANIGVVILGVAALAFLRQGTGTYQALTTPVAGYLGRLSYSLYLWHWPILVLSRWTVGVHWWTIPFQGLLILVLADLSYRWVERPLRGAEWNRSAIATVGIGIGAVIGAAALVGLLLHFHHALYIGQRAELIGHGVSSLSEPYRIPGTTYRWAGEPCVLSDNKEAGLALPLSDCTFGDFEAAKTRVLVVGNSYSAALAPAFEALVTQDDFAVTVTSSWGASPIKGLSNTSAWAIANDYYWSELIPDVEARLRPGDWVLLASDLSQLDPTRGSAASDASLDRYAGAVGQYALELEKRGIRLAVLGGLPFAREANCTPDAATPQWFTPTGGPCRFYSREQTLTRLGGLSDRLRRLEASGAIRTIDLFPIFCPTDVCGYLSPDGRLLYRDEFSHPSVEAAQISAPIVRQVLRTQANHRADPEPMNAPIP